MSEKFIVEGGLSIPSGKKLDLQGTELDASAEELNYFNTFGLTGINTDNDMASASGTSLASDESIKAYVDAQLGASVLTFQTDDASDNEVDLDDDTLIMNGASGITTSNTNDTITITLSDLNSFDTDDLSEGTNLYYTEARWDTKLAAADTDDLTEGSSNLYYTDARVHAAVSATDSGGDGSFSYDAAGGFTYTGPSAAETRAHFSAGAGLDVSAGDFSVNVDDSGIEIDSDTLQLKDSGVTLAKHADIANMRLIGNVSGASATPAAVTILSENAMDSDSATAVCTQQSIKAYVDDQLTAEDLDVAGDSGTLDIDLDSETFTIAGTSNEIETSASGTTLTIGLPDDVSGLTSIEATTVGDGTATLTSGSLDSVDSITMSGTFTDGTMSIASGSLTDVDSITMSGTFTDGTASLASGSWTDVDSITMSGTFSDGTGSLSAGTWTSLVSVTSTTLTDGTCTINGGSLSDVDAITATGTIDFSGTTNLDAVDIDGAVDMATTLTLAGNADFNGDLDVDGTTNLDAVDIDGAVDCDGALSMGSTITVGVDDTGHDVKFFGATSGSYLLWDESSDLLAWDSRSAMKPFNVSLTDGSATSAISFASGTYKSAKVSYTVYDSSGNYTAREILVVCDGTDTAKLVEYGTVSAGTEVSLTWTVADDGSDCTISVAGANGDVLNGHVTYIK